MNGHFSKFGRGPAAGRLVTGLAVLLLGGCAARGGLYDWGGYEDSLYLLYNDHDFVRAEAEVYQTLPQPGGRGRVPPGVYADYGFLLFRRGDYAGAIANFEREKQTFPESSMLMNKLIGKVRERQAGPAAGAGASPAAGGDSTGRPAAAQPPTLPVPAGGARP